MNLDEIKARLVEIADLTAAVSKVAEDEGRPLNEDDNSQILALSEEFDSLNAAKGEIEAEASARAEREAKVQEAFAKIVEARETQEISNGVQPLSEEKAEVSIPAKAKYNKSRVFASSEDAYMAGQFLAAVGGSKKAAEFLNVQEVGTDDKGGFTVPTPLSSELINLVESYGVARNVCKRVVMGAMTWSVPKLVGHSTIYYPAESAAITASDLTFDQVTLTAKKMAGLVKMSTEISEDSVISMTDTIVQDLAWGFAKAEDENLFVGGSLYTGGIEGDANVADTNVASVAALALTDLTAAMVASGQERGLSPEWYMSPTLYHGQVRDLLNAAGGNTIGDLEGGQRPTLLGYPVNLVNAIPGAAAVSGDLIAVFGDLRVSHYFGDRRSLNFNVLRELFAVNDQVGVICTQRVDIASVNPEVISKVSIT